MKRIRPPVKYHGGKYYLAPWIVSFFPPHKTYIECFGGAASVLLNKPPSQKEIYYDVEPSITNLIRVIRDWPDQFMDEIKKIEYNLETFEKLKSTYWGGKYKYSMGSIRQAATTFGVRRMSRGGLGRSFCWSSRMYNGVPAEIHSWQSMMQEIPIISRRLKKVFIRQGGMSLSLDDAKYNNEDCLHYLDPPYPKECRQDKNSYLCEMDDEDHKEISRRVHKLKGKVIISSYPSSLYTELYKGWRVESRQIPNHSSQKKVKEKKIEVLYLNF